MIKIQVKYSCVLCGIENAEVQVPARDSSEDLTSWMNQLSHALAEDHVRRSPHCRPKKLQNVMIPLENAGWVGGPPVQ